MTTEEKTLRLKLDHIRLRLREWEKEWESEGRAPTTKKYWQQFQKFIREEREQLEKELDQILYINVV